MPKVTEPAKAIIGCPLKTLGQSQIPQRCPLLPRAPDLPGLHALPVLTSTCHTCSLALRKLQKRTLAPSSPWPPHMLLGTTSTSRTFMVFMLNTSSFTGFSTLAFSRAFSVSFSLFCTGQEGPAQSEASHPWARTLGPVRAWYEDKLGQSWARFGPAATIARLPLPSSRHPKSYQAWVPKPARKHNEASKRPLRPMSKGLTCLERQPS